MSMPQFQPEVPAVASPLPGEEAMSSLGELFHFYCLRPTGGSDFARLLQVPIFVACVLYIPVVYGLQWHMRNRPAYKLKTVCFVWNLALSVLSLLGFFIILFTQPVLLTKAIYPETQFVPPVRAVICFFTLTKAIEFGDTIILCLRKKPLIFLHVYHHLTVTLYCWHAQLVTVSMGHNFAFINLGIHGVMYLYYAFSVLQARHPILLACRPYITLSQTVQMFVGIFLSYEALMSDLSAREHLNANIALAMYASYFVLFGKFYVEAYMRHLRPKTTQLVVTVHTLAVGGIWILWGHKRRLEVAVELLVFSGATVLVLPIVRKAYLAALSSCARDEATVESFIQPGEPTPALKEMRGENEAESEATDADTAPGSPDTSPSKFCVDGATGAQATPLGDSVKFAVEHETAGCRPMPLTMHVEKAAQQCSLGACQAALTVSNFLLSWAVEGMMTAAALAQSDLLSRSPSTHRSGTAVGGECVKATKASESQREQLVRSVPQVSNLSKTRKDTHAHLRIFDGLIALIQKPSVETDAGQTPAEQPAVTAPATKPAPTPSECEANSPTGSDSTADSTTGDRVTPKSVLEDEHNACTGGSDGAGELGKPTNSEDKVRVTGPTGSIACFGGGKGQPGSPRNRGPLGSMMDVLLVLLSFAVPCAYGWMAHDSCLLGLCVFGALRWIIELYTSDKLIKTKIPGAERLCAITGGSPKKSETRRDI